MHLYSDSLSTIATIFSLVKSELLPAFFSCSNKFYLSQCSLGFSGRFIVENPETMIAGDLSNLTRDLSLGLLLSGAISLKYFSFAKSYYTFIR